MTRWGGTALVTGTFYGISYATSGELAPDRPTAIGPDCHCERSEAICRSVRTWMEIASLRSQ
jgi:hypothetical protein